MHEGGGESGSSSSMQWGGAEPHQAQQAKMQSPAGEAKGSLPGPPWAAPSSPVQPGAFLEGGHSTELCKQPFPLPF